MIKQITEKDRKATEKRLLETIGRMIAENGFEEIGINAVAAQSGVSKILIYRYFKSVEGLKTAYIRQHDFWINFPHKAPKSEELAIFIKRMFCNQIEQLRNDLTIKRLYRWELSTNNELIDELRKQREETGLWLVELVAKMTKNPVKEVATIATLLSASITYLAMLGEFCPQYNGIPLNENKGWKQIMQGIDLLIDMWLENVINKHKPSQI